MLPGICQMRARERKLGVQVRTCHTSYTIASGLSSGSVTTAPFPFVALFGATRVYEAIFSPSGRNETASSSMRARNSDSFR